MKSIGKIGTLVAAIALTGCASSFDVERSDFGCSGMPVGVKCLSAKEVYAATESSDYVNGDIAQRFIEKNKGKQQRQAEPTRTGGAAGLIVPAADKPLPIRHPSRVMRVWINSFEDADGDLYAGQYVFTEIEPRRWSIGAEKGGQSGMINPLASGGRNSIRETVSPLSPVPKSTK